MIPSSLAGARALVTGGGHGIGSAIVGHLAAAGCHVVVHYRSSAGPAAETVAAAQAAGVRARAIAADLTREAEAQRLAAESADFLGGIDILVNNAGDLVARRTLDAIDTAFWQGVQDVNVTSLMLVCRACLPHLANPASIVNVASLAGRKGGHPGSLAYATAKGAVLTFTRALSSELAPRGVRVNAVAPGLILGTRFHATHTSKASADQTVAGIPLGRAGAPEDVARAVAFLAAERVGFITGATIDINGGVYCA